MLKNYYYSEVAGGRSVFLGSVLVEEQKIIVAQLDLDS
jgi:hypothetical protein